MARLIGNVDATGSLSTSVSTPATNASAVSLYLPFDSDVNDASANGFSGTASNGAAVSSAQAKFNSSLALDGTNDYLTVATGSELQNFNSAPFTIEGFFYCTEDTTSTYQIIMSTGTGTGNWRIVLLPSTKLFEFYDGAAFGTTGSWSVNTWHHFAVCGDGTNVRQFIDGVQIRSDANTNVTAANSNITLGVHPGGSSNYFTGYLDDIRITKGIALYTQNFVPPSQAVGASLSGGNETNSTTGFTSLYLPLDSDIADDSPHGHSVTASGNAAVSSTQSKFGGSSLFIDASGDFLSLSTDSTFRFAEGDFTIELFIRPDDVNTTDQVSNLACILDHDANAGTGVSAWFALHQENQALVFGANNATIITTSNCLSAATFHHVAVVRSGTVLTIFCDGVNVGSATHSVDHDDSTTRSLYIGKQNVTFGGGNAGGTRRFDGYIDDLRILKGFAKYTADFTPPTSAVGTSVSQTRNDLAVLYLPFDSGLADKARNHPVTANGDAAISATQAKFGGKSLYLDGTGDFLTIPNSGEFNFKGEDFSIEAWVYPTALNSNQGVFSKWGANGHKTLKLVVDNSGNVSLQASKDGSTGTQVNVTSSAALSLNAWAHIAGTRSGDVYTVYINGTASGTQTVSGDLYESSSDVGIGANRADQTTNLFTGYIDDLLCVVGFAKTYGSAPTAASGGEVLGTTTDSRTFSSVWNLNSAVVAENFKAGTWPS